MNNLKGMQGNMLVINKIAEYMAIYHDVKVFVAISAAVFQRTVNSTFE